MKLELGGEPGAEMGEAGNTVRVVWGVVGW